MKILVTSDTHYNPKDVRSVVSNTYMLNNIAKEDFDVMLHCGDIGSHETSHVEDYLKLMRKYIPKGESLGMNKDGVSLGYKKDIFITIHNHDLWSSKYKNISTINTHIYKACQQNDIRGFNAFHPSFADKYLLIGFRSWYASGPPTNDYKYIPKYDFKLSTKLKHQSDLEFQYAIYECKKAKEQGKTTVMFTHFPFTEEVRELDYKTYGNNYYFGASLGYENFLDDVDYLFYGHTHIAYEGYAKNGHTRVINVGSDYYDPKYKIFEV